MREIQVKRNIPIQDKIFIEELIDEVKQNLITTDEIMKVVNDTYSWVSNKAKNAYDKWYSAHTYNNNTLICKKYNAILVLVKIYSYKFSSNELNKLNNFLDEYESLLI